MNSTSSNVTMAQICKFGTGMVNLIFDHEIYHTTLIKFIGLLIILYKNYIKTSL